MFLIRLIHLSGTNIKNENSTTNHEKESKQDNFSSQIVNKDTVNQIKNVAQEKKTKPETQLETKASNKIFINSFDELLNICSFKKEMKLKYELEKNVNLVKFENGRIEISFNDDLDKDFVKDLSTKLFEWTNQRWIISFSKIKGEISIKEREKNKHKELIENAKKSELYKTMLNHFSDAELVDVKSIQKDNKNND